MRNAKGFTLLEVMLVLALVGMISIGVVMTLPSSASLNKNSQWHAQRLASLIELVQDQALITNKEFGIEFAEQGYRFARYSLQDKKWQAFSNARINGDITIPDTITVEYALLGNVWDEIEQEDSDPFLEKAYLVEDEEQEKAIKPQVFIMSSGEVTPFSYRFYNSSNEKDKMTLTVNMSGQIELLYE